MLGRVVMGLAVNIQDNATDRQVRRRTTKALNASHRDERESLLK